MDDPSRSLLDQALAFAAAGHWEPALLAYERLAEVDTITSAPERAHGVFAAAGDAALRADRPVRAVVHLQRALQLAGSHPLLAPLRCVQLAGAFLAVGELQAALSVLADAQGLLSPSSREHTASVRVLLADVRVGVHLLRGSLHKAEQDLSLLEGAGSEGARLGALFRRGQLEARQGRFEQALERFHRCLSMAGGAKMVGLRAAVWEEITEALALTGEHDGALAALDEAGRAWTAAGRRSGLLRVEATRMRLLCSAGRCDMLTTNLERSLDYAEERQMRLLQCQILIALGRCRERDKPWRARVYTLDAVQVAEQAGAGFLAGIARLGLRGNREALVLAAGQLAESPFWYNRAQEALAEVPGASDPR